MDGSNIEALALKNGARPTFAQIRALERNIAAQAPARGRGVRYRQYPWGVVPFASGGVGGGAVSPIFQPDVTKKGGSLFIAWQDGVIGGFRPAIEGVPINHDPAPSYEIPITPAFFAGGESLVYFRLTLEPQTFFVSGIAPVAFSDVPTFVPYTAYKLACIVSAAGDIVHRALYSDLGFMAVNRRNNGLFLPVYWSLS